MAAGLSEGNPADAEKVWSTLKGKPLQMLAHIISIDTSARATKLMLAGSADDIEAKRADIDLTMTAAIPTKQMPKEDTDFQFEGTPVSYVPKPFVMTMNEGALLVKAAPRSRLSARSRRRTESQRSAAGLGLRKTWLRKTCGKKIGRSRSGPPFFVVRAAGLVAKREEREWTDFGRFECASGLVFSPARGDARCGADAWLRRAEDEHRS